MKKYIFSLLIASLVACEDNSDPIFQVESELRPYVDVFYAEAAERGVTIERNLVARLADYEVQGIAKTDKRGGQRHLLVDRAVFNSMKAAGAEHEIEALVVYQLAGSFLGRPLQEIVDLENIERGIFPEYDRESTFDALLQ